MPSRAPAGIICAYRLRKLYHTVLKHATCHCINVLGHLATGTWTIRIQSIWLLDGRHAVVRCERGASPEHVEPVEAHGQHAAHGRAAARAHRDHLRVARAARAVGQQVA